MSDTYKEAIDIVCEERCWREICIEIAKSNPSVLIKAYNKLTWEHKVKGMTKIEAIKECRRLTGFGLLEAKEAVERLDEFRRRQ